MFKRSHYLVLLSCVAGACILYAFPPFAVVHRGEVLVRSDAIGGAAKVFAAGTVPLLPGIQQVRRFSMRDQVFRPAESASATGPAPFQSIEGLSIGIDVAVRWAVDPAQLSQTSRQFP